MKTLRMLMLALVVAGIGVAQPSPLTRMAVSANGKAVITLHPFSYPDSQQRTSVPGTMLLVCTTDPATLNFTARILVMSDPPLIVTPPITLLPHPIIAGAIDPPIPGNWQTCGMAVVLNPIWIIASVTITETHSGPEETVIPAN